MIAREGRYGDVEVFSLRPAQATSRMTFASAEKRPSVPEGCREVFGFACGFDEGLGRDVYAKGPGGRNIGFDLAWVAQDGMGANGPYDVVRMIQNGHETEFPAHQLLWINYA